MLQIVPRVWISSGPGLSRVASCWAERKIRLPFTSAYSRALMELGRPITNGIIMWGKTTTSRSGTIGRVSITSTFSLSRQHGVSRFGQRTTGSLQDQNSARLAAGG